MLQKINKKYRTHTHYIECYRKEGFKSQKCRHRSTITQNGDGGDYFSISSIEWNEYLSQYIYLLNAGGINGFYISFSDDLTSYQFNNSNSIKIADHAESGSSCYNELFIPQLFEHSGQIVKIACTFTSMWSETPSDTSGMFKKINLK